MSNINNYNLVLNFSILEYRYNVSASNCAWIMIVFLSFSIPIKNESSPISESVSSFSDNKLLYISINFSFEKLVFNSLALKP